MKKQASKKVIVCGCVFIVNKKDAAKIENEERNRIRKEWDKNILAD